MRRLDGLRKTSEEEAMLVGETRFVADLRVVGVRRSLGAYIIHNLCLNAEFDIQTPKTLKPYTLPALLTAIR